MPPRSLAGANRFRNLAALAQAIEDPAVIKTILGSKFKLHRETFGRRADRVQPEIPQPVRLQTCAFATESGAGLGRKRAAIDRVRVLRAQPEVWRQGCRGTRDESDHHARKHARDCIKRIEWRCGSLRAAEIDAENQRPSEPLDRWCSRRRTEYQPGPAPVSWTVEDLRS
jgi:hypothetical protein